MQTVLCTLVDCGGTLWNVFIKLGMGVHIMKLNRWACLICFLYTPHTVNSLVVFLFKNLYVGRGAGRGGLHLFA